MRSATVSRLAASCAVVIAALACMPPAEAAIGSTRVRTAGTATELVQPVVWVWRGRRYHHRRWHARRYNGRAWVSGHWAYY